MKIILINHTFQQKQFSKRWMNLAKEHPDWDITLIAPSKWTWGSGKAVTFGKEETRKGYEVDDNNYHVRTVRIIEHKLISWTSNEMIDLIRTSNPDVVYHIGSHTQESLIQILRLKKTMKHTKFYAFSMRGPQQDIANIVNLRRNDKNYIKKALRCGQYLYEKYKVGVLNRNCDAIFCHYPDGMESFRREGYKGPIFLQTQVGVDCEVFYPDLAKREKVRSMLGVKEDEYLFASAVRFNPSKGILKVLDALPIEGKWKYMLMGSGLPDEIDAVKEKIKERGLENKVILPGFIQWEDMASYWNAADCAIHFTQTTTTWIETFSLALVQAMATRIPVIGSTSGSVPYQIGPDGIIVAEDDIHALHEKMQWIMKHQDEGKIIGDKLYKRTVRSFSTRHLNSLFYKTVNELLNGVYNEDSIDMANPKNADE